MDKEFITLGNVKVEYVVVGNGFDLMLLHGGYYIYDDYPKKVTETIQKELL